MDTVGFLTLVQGQLATLNQARASYQPRLASDFNVFDFISPDENRLSQILASLLDPEGPHAQGSLFLELIGSPGKASGKATIATEVRTDRIDRRDRRIDILIRWSGFALAIENKP